MLFLMVELVLATTEVSVIDRKVCSHGQEERVIWALFGIRTNCYCVPWTIHVLMSIGGLHLNVVPGVVLEARGILGHVKEFTFSPFGGAGVFGRG